MVNHLRRADVGREGDGCAAFRECLTIKIPESSRVCERLRWAPSEQVRLGLEGWLTSLLAHLAAASKPANKVAKLPTPAGIS